MRNLRTKKRYSLSGLLVLAGVLLVFAEGSVDSLQRLLPRTQGKERIGLLNELCYQLRFKDVEQAIAYGRESLVLAVGIGDSALTANSLNDLSMAWLNYGDYEKVLDLNRKALAIRVALGDSLGVASSQSKISNAWFELGRLDKAVSTNMRALSIYEAAALEPYMARIYNNLGSAYEKNGDYEEALRFRQEALTLAEKHQDPYTLITAQLNVAHITQKMEDYDQAAGIFQAMIPLAEELGEKEYLSSIYQGLGVNERMQGNTKAGIRYYEKALGIYEQMGSQTGISLILVNLGNCYADLGQYDQAEPYLKKGIAISSEIRSFTQLGHAYNGMYEMEKARGNYDLALIYHEKVLQYRDSVYTEGGNALLADMRVKYQTEKRERQLAQSEAALANEQVKVKQRNLMLLIALLGLVLVSTGIFLVIYRNRINREKIRQQAQLNLQHDRLRISRDLHDHIGAELTLISSSLDTKAYKTADPEEKNALEKISRYAKNAMAQLRETIWAIKKDETSLEQFTVKLMEFCQQRADHEQLSITVNPSGEGTLGPAQTINLFRICQEAVNNAVKYAEGSDIRLDLTADANLLTLTVVDHGPGFSDKGSGRGYGLQHMKQRTAELNGNFKLDSKPGQGTTVQIVIPLNG